MDIIENLKNSIRYNSKQVEAEKEALNILKDKEKVYLEMWEQLEEVREESKANYIEDGHYYAMDILRTPLYYIYKDNNELENGEIEYLLNISRSIDEYKIFILIEKDYNIRFFISKIESIYTDKAKIDNENKYLPSISLVDTAYEVTKEDLNKIEEVLEGK